MRSKNIVKCFFISISVSVLLVNTANIKSFAQDSQDTSIVKLIQLANSLENQYEEINTELRNQVNGWTEIDRESIGKLVNIQDNLVVHWNEFESNFCQQNTNN